MKEDVEGALISSEPIMNTRYQNIHRVLDKALFVGTPTCTSNSMRWSSRGVRYVVPDSEGQGYSDFFKISDSLFVTVTESIYNKDTWISVEGDRFFKFRVLLSGTLLRKTGDTLAKAPEGSLFVSPGTARAGFYIAGNEPIRMVALHCRPELLTRVLGLNPGDIPLPLDKFFVPGQEEIEQRLSPVSDVIQTARLLSNSRGEVKAALVGPYREYLSMQLLMHVLKALDDREGGRGASSTLRPRDLDRIYAAREFLSRNYVKPPTISTLARFLGINQTKLKAGFKEVTRTTIYEFILECRMKRAAALLHSGEFAVAEVAYAVGYSYPANFTHAFKKYHGTLPRGISSSRHPQ
jgi:AraC-like DNA-binding protein